MSDTIQPSPTADRDLLTALADVVRASLGPQGSFPGLGLARTEEILLLLLRHGMPLRRAHDRIWNLPIPDELVDAVRAAGGKTRAEWQAGHSGAIAKVEGAR